jgi:hypothetical protein
VQHMAAPQHAQWWCSTWQRHSMPSAGAAHGSAKACPALVQHMAAPKHAQWWCSTWQRHSMPSGGSLMTLAVVLCVALNISSSGNVPPPPTSSPTAHTLPTQHLLKQAQPTHAHLRTHACAPAPSAPPPTPSPLTSSHALSASSSLRRGTRPYSRQHATSAPLVAAA